MSREFKVASGLKYLLIFFFMLSNNTTYYDDLTKSSDCRGQIASILDYSETKIFKEKIT